VALLLTVIIGISAVAIDLSRLYVGVNELQTAVDAAALRGALALQRGVTNPEPDVRNFIASANPVLGSNFSGPVEVTARRYGANGSWSATTFTATGSQTANAVRVTATLSGSLLFGRVFELPAMTVQRSATAWVAGLPLTCVRTLMFDFDRVYEGIKGVSPVGGATEANFGKLYTQEPVYLTIAPPTATANPNTPNGGRWVGVALAGNGNSQVFRSQFNNCNAAPPTVNTPLENATEISSISTSEGVVDVFLQEHRSNGPGNGNGAQPFCPNANGDDDSCNRSNNAMLGNAASDQPFATTNVDHTPVLLITFRVVCVKRPSRTVGGGKNKQVIKTTCSSHQQPDTWADQPAGTIYGYLELDKLPAFTGNSQLGAGGTTSKRLVLVE
jgi:hypothetical protein